MENAINNDINNPGNPKENIQMKSRDSVQLIKNEIKKIHPHLSEQQADSASKQLISKGNNGKVNIIDYKSDSKKVDFELFEKSLSEKYEGQMLLYRYSMSKLFHIPLEDVSVELYHLYGTI